MIHDVPDGEAILTELDKQYSMGVPYGSTLIVGGIAYILYPENTIDMTSSKPGHVSNVMHVHLGGNAYAEVLTVCLDPEMNQGKTFETLIGPVIFS